MTIRINRVAAPITVLGPGVRVGVWVQGCTIGCSGCASVDTWDAAGGVEWHIDALIAEVVAAARRVEASGLTLTGGEPFQQPEALARLVAGVREAWPGSAPVDVLVFTGYAAGAARRVSPDLWEAADIVVAGPYRRDRPAPHPLLASANQTLTAHTELGRERLADAGVGRPRMQLSVSDGTLSLAGMPDAGDLDRLRASLEARGIRFADVSWEEAG